MKGVILAAGKGTRLAPITTLINKHLLPVGKRPMLHYAVDKLAEAGVKDILLIIPKLSAGLFCQYFGSGEKIGVNITYRIQDESEGIGDALRLAEGFIQPRDKFVLVLGDNIFDDSLRPFVTAFNRQKKGAKVLLKQVDDLHRFGVPELDGTKIKRIEEKPAVPKSQYCVTGIYLYDSTVFDKVRSIRPSDRGELEITDINNLYAVEGNLTYDILHSWWTDAGTPGSLLEAGQHKIGDTDDG